MIEFIAQLIPAVVILGVLIFVHELGHFLACRYVGVGVEKFSIGFGPELVSWQGRETRYSISAIPFGGFVKPKGESSEEIEKQGGVSKPGDFFSWIRVRSPDRSRVSRKARIDCASFDGSKSLK